MTTNADSKRGGPSVARARELLTMSPATRAEEGVSEEQTRAALKRIVREGDKTDKQLGAITLPAVDFTHEVLEGRNNHPLDLTGATIESLDLSHASVRTPILLDDATVGELRLDDARFERYLTAEDATVETLQTHEATFEGNFEFARSTLTGPFDASETTFEDDVSFDEVTFEGSVVFDGAELYGESNRLDDNTTFQGCTFEKRTSFTQTTFGFTDFSEATFSAESNFTEASIDGDIDFTGVTFESAAVFDEFCVDEDTTFTEVGFESAASFRGAEFRGGATAIEDDATFESVTFSEEADFSQAQFRYVNFCETRFVGEANFETAVYDADADFVGATFEAHADFDEARFRASADFSDAAFEARCTFRGAEFHGGENHLSVAATFSGASFHDDADFDSALFTTAAFEDAVFSDVADFREATFREQFVFEAIQRTNEAYVDFTGATLKEGRIVQPEGGWVRYDMTNANLGSVELDAPTVDAHRELLDYFRFCETAFSEFDGYDFDFTDHTDYFDRNDWVLHDFEQPAGTYEPATPMVPETIERTYLKAKNAASAVGNQQAAGEFRVKRQEFARRKFWGIVGDASEDTGTRLQNFARALENRFLGITCGHGLRLGRIFAVFLLFPLLPALLYTYGGVVPGVDPSFFETAGVIENRTVGSLDGVLSSSGIDALYSNLAFAYVTFLTIGYGNAAPKGAGANILAAGSVYVSVVLGGLLLYALIKRSEL